MSGALEFISQLFFSGIGNLAAYLAAHVLLCLLPAFYIAGAMTALIPKETITRYLGRNTLLSRSSSSRILTSRVLLYRDSALCRNS